MSSPSSYPTLEQIEAADRRQLCYWWRFLPIARNEKELDLISRIVNRCNDAGGFTSEISREIGW